VSFAVLNRIETGESPVTFPTIIELNVPTSYELQLWKCSKKLQKKKKSSSSQKKEQIQAYSDVNGLLSIPTPVEDVRKYINVKAKCRVCYYVVRPKLEEDVAEK